jgi:Protein of unknown function (DUF2510)
MTRAAGWLGEPHGSHELRYWDGENWTSHTSDNGLQSTSARPYPPPPLLPPRNSKPVQRLGASVIGAWRQRSSRQLL